MTILFVFFVLPLVTILLAIVLQKILKNPILVGITFFAVYLIIAFTAFSANLAAAVIGAIILSIIAFITAIIVQFICILRQRFSNDIPHNNCSCHGCCCNNENNETQTISDSGNLLRISCNCQNGESNDLLTINSNCNCNNNNNNNGNDSDNSNSCGCNNREEIVINEQANPINANIRRYCCNRGYRRS